MATFRKGDRVVYYSSIVAEWDGWIGSVITVDLLNPAAVVVKWDNMPGCPQTVKSSSIAHYIAPLAEPTPFKPGDRVRVTGQTSDYHLQYGTVTATDSHAPWTIRVSMDKQHGVAVWFRPDVLELVQVAPSDDQRAQLAAKDKCIAELQQAVVDWKAEEARVRKQRDAARAETIECLERAERDAIRASGELRRQFEAMRAENKRLKQKCNRWLGRYHESSAIVDRQRAVINAIRPIVEAVADAGYWDGSYQVSRKTVDAALAVLASMEAKG